MKIKFWGARGSIPVSGAEFVKFGGDTACVEITSAAGHKLIIDAGTGIRNLGKRMIADKTDSCSLIFTHAHWDHIMGFPFFRPIYRKNFRLELYGCPIAKHAVKDMISRTMQPPNFPVKFEDIAAHIGTEKACGESFFLDGVHVSPVPLSHPGGGTGYKLVENGRSFVFLTDNELGHVHPGGLKFDEYAAVCEGADLLVHDGDYLPEEYSRLKTWGHSSYTDALRLAMAAKVKRFAFFHHNQDRTDQAIDAIVAESRKMLEKAGMGTDCFAVAAGMETVL